MRKWGLCLNLPAFLFVTPTVLEGLFFVGFKKMDIKMKYLIFVLFFRVALFGQMTIFSENMYSGSGGANGDAIGTHETNNRFEQDSFTYSGTGDMRTSSASTGYTGVSGTWNVMMNASGETFIIDGINASTYNSLVLSFGIGKAANAVNGSSLVLEYSTTGTTGTYTTISWSALPTGTGTSYGTTYHYRSSSSTIPSNVTTIRFRTTNTDEYRIDDVKLTGTLITTPEINLQGNGVTIADEDISPSTADHTNFGTTTVSTDIARTFTIQNTGTADLTITNVTLNSGTNFVVTGISTPLTIASGNSNTFTLTFNSASVGTFTDVVNVFSNDTDEATYNFNIQATTVIAPVITSALTASGSQNSAFTYTITALNSPSSFAASGLPSGLSIDTATGIISGTPTVFGVFNIIISASNVAGTDNQTLVLTLAESCYTATFESASKGSYVEDTVTIDSKDWILGECLIGNGVNDYTIGSNSARMRANANAIIELNNALSTGLSTISFNYRNYGTDPVAAIFSVDYSKDNGNSWLTAGYITPSASVQTFSATVNQPGSVKFRIKFSSGTTNDSHRVNIDNIQLCPYYNTQEIEVFGNSTTILNGDTTTKASNATDFGDDYFVGDAPIVKTYTITNYGNGTLNLSGLSISGASEFSISGLSSTSLASLASATFTVSFSAVSTGLKSAVVTIVNDDTDENPFTFAVSCFSNDYTKCALQAYSTVGFQDFEGSGTLTATSTGGSFTTAGGQNYGDNRSTKTDMFVGTASYQVTGANSHEVIFSGINTVDYKNVKFSFRIGAYAKTTAQGMETSDKVLVSISQDGGTSWSEQLIITGNNNAISDINTSSGSAITNAYDSTLLTGKRYGMSENSTNTFANSFVINDLPSVAQLKVKFNFQFSTTGGTNEVWVIDNLIFEGQLPQSTTWNGSSWTAGIPTPSTKAIIDGDYTTTIDDVQACECEIKSGRTFTVATNDYLEVQSNVVVNGDLVIEDDGSFVQVNDYAVNSGTGVHTLKRNPENLQIFDYVYWSTPQASTPFATIPNSRYYEWVTDYQNPTGYGYGNWFVPSGSNMTVGKGYIFRVPSNLNQNTIFTGSTFNNGIITTQIKKGPYTISSSIPPGVNGPITRFDDNWNLIGNPYPSAIDAMEFVTDNAAVLESGTVALWRHLTPISSSISSPYYQSFVYNYSSDDYVIYNGSGAVPFGAFDGKIASGQGFFVSMKDDVSVPSTSSVSFNNSQRNRSYNNAQFFRSAISTPRNELEKHRIWLDLVDSNKKAVSQMIGYIEGATNEDDFLFESKSSLMTGFQFYSILNSQFYKIQGRQLPFNDADIVPLGVIVPADGNYIIALNNVDGSFKTNYSKIYLEDKVTNTLHDLTQAPYQFNLVKGNYTDRFVLRFNDSKLSNPSNEALKDAIKVFVKEDKITINSKKEAISSYEVYNVLGQLLVKASELNVFEVQVDKQYRIGQPLIVKVLTESGVGHTVKLMF